MSPALIDSGLQSQALGGALATSLVNRGQISSPLVPSGVVANDRVSPLDAMNRADGVNPNFQFSAASMSKPTSDKPAFQGLSEPRMAKTRKSQHNRAVGGPEPRNFDAAFNRFLSVSDHYKAAPSVDLDSAASYAGESVFNKADDGSPMLGVKRMTSGLNANLDSSIIDEMRKMRLRDEKGAGGDRSSSSQLPPNAKDSKQLDASISSGKHFSVTGDSQTNIGFGRGGDGVGLLTGLPNELKKLNIKGPSVAVGNGLSFSPHGNCHFEFGNRDKESDSVAFAMADAITNRMRNLDVKADSHNAKEETKLYDEKATFSFSNRGEGSQFSRETHIMILDELGKLKLGDEFKQSDNPAGLGESSSRAALQPDSNDGTQSKHQFAFTSKLHSTGTSYGDFNTPSPKLTSFASFNQKVEFGAKREPIKDNLSEQMKRESKESTHDQLWGGANHCTQESSFHDEPEPSESNSPMDVSPYRETVPDNQSLGETSFTSEKFVYGEENLASNECQSACGDAIDEDLICATECLGIDECRDSKTNESVAAQASSEESVSVGEIESFNSANEFFDISGQNEEVSSRLNDDEVQSRGSNTQFFSASSSESSGEISFTFSASSSIKDHVAPAMRNQKKKSRTKVGQDPYISQKDTFSSFSRGSSPFNTRNEDLSSYHRKEGPSLEVEEEQPVKQESLCPSAAASAAKEACEKWRLRGNQAYLSGELHKAEECYTQGVNCISKGEVSGDGLRALMLCYSNRAAIQMALGRFRDALTDCCAAAEIDPNFFKVQVRTANCYLVLGEVAEASQLLTNVLQSGSEACADSKLILEASEIIQKSQKVSQCIDHSAELLQYKTLNNAEASLHVIDEGLAICPYSEKLLQMKAEALFMMQRYKEVILLCEQTLQSAEKNFPLLVSDNELSNLDPSELSKKYYFRVWRHSLIFSSYYYLGKLEEGLDFLEKQTDLRLVTERCGTKFESLIPLLVPARELVKHKSAGNAAYQAGKHAEALENYTAALACNPQSCPFAAVCFGNRAAAYQALGQIADAIADCNMAVALDRNYFKAISRRATLFEMIRDYREAANDLQTLVSLLTKQAEDKSNQFSATDRPAISQADLRHAHMRLARMEELAIKEPLLDYYLILGVETSATPADIKKAYHKAALRHHPDKACQLLIRGENVDDGIWKEMSEDVQKEADRLFKMIGEVYSILSDPTKRFRYDVEVRNTWRKTGIVGSASRMHSDGQSYSYGYQRSSSSGRSAWESPGNPPNQRYERSSRFH